MTGAPTGTATGTVSGATTGNISMPPDPSCVPDLDCRPDAPDTGDFHVDCFTRVNQFRECMCLPALTRNSAAESCLDQQSAYDAANGPHAGFSDEICQPNGSAQNSCPGWQSERQVIEGCLQSMFDEGPPPTEECSGQCYQDHGHFINMTNERYSQVACGIAVVNGEVWSVHNFYR